MVRFSGAGALCGAVPLFWLKSPGSAGHGGGMKEPVWIWPDAMNGND